MRVAGARRVIQLRHSSLTVRLHRAPSPSTPAQPALRELPVAHDRLRGYFEHSGGLLDRQTGKESELDDAAFPLVVHGQRLERIVEGDEVGVTCGGTEPRLVERDSARSATPLLIAARAGEIHEDLAHDARRYGKEVGAVLPLDLLDVNQAEVSLVDERRRLKAMAWALSSHLPASEPVKLAWTSGVSSSRAARSPSVHPTSRRVTSWAERPLTPALL